MSYYALGQYDKAAQAYEALISSDQTYFTKAQLYSSAAKCRVLLAQYDEAITQCTAGLQTGDTGEAATLYALRGTAYMATSSYSDAVSDYLAAIDNGYEDPASLYTQCAACSYYMETAKTRSDTVSPRRAEAPWTLKRCCGWRWPTMSLATFLTLSTGWSGALI
jgi:tetratricopeptide (TPR) repeat protein